MRPAPPPPAPVDTMHAQRDDLCALGSNYGLDRLWVAGDGLMVAELGRDPGDYLAVVEFERRAEDLLDGYVAVVPLSAYHRQPFGRLEEL